MFCNNLAYFETIFMVNLASCSAKRAGPLRLVGPARPGGVLLAISTLGPLPGDSGELAALCDHCLRAPSASTPVDSAAAHRRPASFAVTSKFDFPCGATSPRHRRGSLFPDWGHIHKP